jgi:hypothetical protein
VVLPAGLDTFSEHSFLPDGTEHPPTVLAQALMVSRKQ